MTPALALSGALATGDALVRGVVGVVGAVGGAVVVVIVGVIGVVVGGCCCRCGWVGGLVASEAAVMRRVSSLRRLGLPLAPRIGRCPCPHRTLSSAAEPEALADANPVQDLALSKGKMKRLKAIAAQKGIESAGVSRPELVQRILSANPTADSASNPQGADDHDEPQSESRPRIEYSEQLKQLSKAYHQLVTRLVAQDNDTAVSATLTRARAAGVEDWVLQTALEQQPMPDLDIAADPTPPEVQARLQAARQETARKAAEAEQRQQDQAAAEAAQRRAQQVEQIEQAIGSDERSAAEVRAECREHGLSSAAARDELLRRLMLHQIWASGEPEGKLPDDLAAVTLEHYTAAQLKTWCIDNRLPHTGTKGDLIDRLEGFSQGTGDHAARAKSRDIQTGAVKKYAPSFVQPQPTNQVSDKPFVEKA